MKTALIAILLFFVLTVFADYAQALCVSVPEANLRSGPGTKYKKTWQVFKYMPFKKTNRKGNWYRVEDVDGDIHWIYRKLVTGKFRCAVVKTNKVNVRSGPGTRFGKAILSPAMKYDSFKVIKIKGSWVNLKDEYGDTGWIFKKLLWIQ